MNYSMTFSISGHVLKAGDLGVNLWKDSHTLPASSRDGVGGPDLFPLLSGGLPGLEAAGLDEDVAESSFGSSLLVGLAWLARLLKNGELSISRDELVPARRGVRTASCHSRY